MEIFYFNTKEEFESFLKNDSLVLIDNNFKLSFKYEGQNYITKYCAMENKIYIMNNEKEIINYNAYNNIIFSNENYNLLFLNQMLKIYYFQEEINQLINSPFNNENNHIIKNFYLINKYYINKYKQIIDYDILYNTIKNNQNINSITYKNLDDNYLNVKGRII